MTALISILTLLTISVDDPGLVRTNGVLAYLGQPFEGVVEVRDPDGTLRGTTPYTSGRKHGVELRWHPNGTLESSRAYDRGTKHGRHQGFLSDGQPRFDFFTVDGEYEGLFRAWYPSGQLYELRHYEHGRENGAQKSWTENGELFANYVVREGRRYGLMGSKLCYTVEGERE